MLLRVSRGKVRFKFQIGTRTQAARGLMDLTVQFGVPVAFGVLTVHDEAQALARARDDEMNKGAEAARAVLAQIALARRWGL